MASIAESQQAAHEADVARLDPTVEEYVPDDSDYGWALFLGFLCAVLSITFAVAVLTLVKSWWMLGVAIATHVTISSMMVRMIIHSMRDTSIKHRRLQAESDARLAAAHA